ncbi:hypothetical protein [Chryseobacterium sp. R2A-55]|uniref:hypothetical protein n=1 Tax=Chryseobacterium sp. R2A-55 TaxID=2744445 RepID=UPI001F3E41B6|nr:hypothetical protein [Chryseobacterium sp. R2A-55]
MSLASEKAAAKTAVKQILEDMLTREETSTEEFANRLIDAMEVWLKKATIKYTSGLMAPNGAVTGTFTGNLE